MNNNFRRLFKNVGVLAIGNFSSKFLVFLLVPLYTNFLSTSEYAVYELSWSAIQIAFPILTINVADSLMVFLLRDDDSNVGDLIHITSLFIIAGSVVFAVGTLITGEITNNISGYEIYIIAYFFIYASSQALMQLAKGMEKVKCIAIAGMIASVVMVGSNIVLLVYFEKGLNGFFIANILSQASSLLFYFFYLKIWKLFSFSARINKELLYKVVGYTAPLIVMTTSWWVNNSLDKYMVAVRCGASIAGLLSIAYKLPTILNTIQQVFLQAWHISGISMFKEKNGYLFYRKIFLYLNGVMVLSCAVLMILSNNIAKILFAKDFFDAWIYTPFLLVASVISAAGGFLGPILSAKLDSKTMAKSGMYGALTNAVLNVVMISYFGVQGAAFASVISSLVIFLVRRKATLSIIIDTNYKWIIISWLILVIEAFSVVLRINLLLQLLLSGFIAILYFVLIARQLHTDVSRYV